MSRAVVQSVTIAILGHGGNVGAIMLKALSGAPSAIVKVLHRGQSDLSTVPAGIQTIQINYDNHISLVHALSGVDVVLSLLGMSAIPVQHKVVSAAKEAGVKLFVPSEFSLAWTREEAALGIPLLQQKFAVEDDLEKHQLPYVHINTGGIAELFFDAPFIGLDVEKNTINVPGEILAPRFTICSSEYIGRMMTALLTEYPLSTFAGKRIYLSEFEPSLEEIATALEAKHGRKPEIVFTPVENLEGALQTTVYPGEKFTAVVRLRWARGGAKAEGNIFNHELKGYQRKTLADYLSKSVEA